MLIILAAIDLDLAFHVEIFDVNINVIDFCGLRNIEHLLLDPCFFFNIPYSDIEHFSLELCLFCYFRLSHIEHLALTPCLLHRYAPFAAASTSSTIF